MNAVKVFAVACLAGGSLLSMQSAQAIGQGDWLVRAGVAHAAPNDSSGELSGVADAKVAVDSATSLGLTLTYMATDNIGVELLGAWPFKHDIEGAGSLSGVGKIAEARQLPPTLVLQYQFTPQASIRPYVGAGVNYTYFFDEDANSKLPAGTKLELSDSWGLAAQAGVDFDVSDAWFLNASVWYMDIDTTAKLNNGLGKVDVEIDPWVVMVGVGTRF